MTESAPRANDRPWVWAILLGVPMICVALLIDRRSIWLDEASSIYVAQHDLAGMIDILSHVDAVFALYYAMLHGWLIFGDGAVWVRMLSVVFALVTLPVAYAIARRFAGREVAFLSTLVLGTSFIFLRYAVEARPYSLELLLCAVSLLFFMKSHDEPRPTNFLVYAAATLGAIYAHPLAVVWLVAQGALIALLPRERRFLKGMLLSWAGIAAGLIPLGAAIRLNGTHQIDWIPPLSFDRVVVALEVLLGGRLGGPFQHGELALLFAVLIAAGAIVLWRSNRRRPALALLTLFVLPLAIMTVVSIWRPVEQVYYFRYTILPACTLAAVAMQSLVHRYGRFSAVAVMAVLIAGGVAQMLTFRGEEWRTVASLLQHDAKASDGLIVYAPYVLKPLIYAQRERHETVPATLLYPTTVPPYGDGQVAALPRDLPARASRTHPHLWLVLSHSREKWQRAVLRPLHRYYLNASTVHVGNIEIVELVARPHGAAASQPRPEGSRG